MHPNISLDQSQQIELTVVLPFQALLQKVDLGLNSKTKILKIMRLVSHVYGQQQFQEIIDFKKHKISYRFKSRMRSNSNEFIDGIPFYNSGSFTGSRASAFKAIQHEDSSPQIIEEDDWEEEAKGTLVCGVSNVFKVLIESDESNYILSEQVVRSTLILKLSIWPTIRMPTGSSTIPLINTLFLLSGRGHKEESNEIDFLVAQSLVNGRKFIQASEKLRAIQAQLLQKQKRDDIYRAMLIEMIIGESMSQHSQISEKVFAFKRAAYIKLQLNQEHIDFQQLQSTLMKIPKEVVKQEEAPQKLFAIKHHLVAIITENLGSNIEVVRNAMLKTLEYLLDQLNCSLEQQIVGILKAICFCYPQSINTYQSNQSNNVRQLEVQGFFQYQFSQQQEITKPVHFFSLHSIHNESECLVKDVKTQSQLFVQSTKNSYNHILENMGIVLASASNSLLLNVFKHVIVIESFNQNLPQELRTYLLKFSNQILQLCSFDLVFPAQFLTEVIEVILESPKKSQNNNVKTKTSRSSSLKNRVQSAATLAVSPNFTNLQQVCLQLYQTLNQRYFSFSTQLNNQQKFGVNSGDITYKNQRTLEWLMTNLQKICAQLQILEVNQQIQQFVPQDFRKLNIFLSIVENVIQSMLQEEQSILQQSNQQLQQQQSQKNKPSINRLQSIFNRQDEELEQEQKFASKSYEFNHGQRFDPQIEDQEYSSQHGIGIQNKMHNDVRYLQVFLPLTQPLIKLLNFSVASQERLSLFKQVWRLLVWITSRLPVKLTKMPHLTSQNLIRPHLTRLNNFMQTSSPSKHMLEFLHIVLTTVELPQTEYQDQLFPTLLKTIPHNLHDEVFKVTSLMLDLLKGTIGQANLRLLLGVLVHKYTMRSKEHKLLVEKVVQKVILSNTQKQIFDCFLAECLKENTFQFNQATYSPDQEAVYFEKLGVLWVAVTHMKKQHIWHFRKILRMSLDSYQKVFKQSIRGQIFVVKILFKLTEFYFKYCGHYNHYQHLHVQTQNIIQISNVVNVAQNPSQPRPITVRSQFNRIQNQAPIYSEPSAELFSIGHHEEDFYVSGGLEDPHIEMDPLVAAYLLPDVEPINRRQRVHYQSQHVEYQPQALINNLVVEDDLAHQSELYESPRQEIQPQYTTSTICDEVDIIDRDRLILIKIHACLIRSALDSQQGETQDHFQQSLQIQKENSSFFMQQQQRNQSQVEDANTKLSVLNLMQNLFVNLLALPTLQNVQVQEMIKKDREQINLAEPVRMQNFDDQHAESFNCSDSDASQNAEDQELLRVNEFSQVQQNTQNIHLNEPNLPYNQVSEVIPEFSEIFIKGETQPRQTEELEESFPAEFECTNQKYICSRILTFLGVSKYLEQIIKSTSWASLKSLAICVLNSAAQIPDVKVLPSKLQRHFKNVIQPLIIRLIQNSKDSESKATALSILAGICNFQLQFNNCIDLDKLKFEQENEQSEDEYSQNSCDIQVNTRRNNQISKISNIDIFRLNTSFISVAIWQEVFDLQDDQNRFIREAAQSLIQLSAPKESVSHFFKIKHEQYKLKVRELLQNQSQYFLSNQSHTIQGQYQGVQDQNETSQFGLNMSSSWMQIETTLVENFEDGSDNSSQTQQSQEFSMGKITDSDLLRIINFFQISSSPVTNLQTERQSYSREQNIDNTQQQASIKGATRQDFYEDGLLMDDRFQPVQNRIQNKKKDIESNEEDEEDSIQSSSSDEVYIFRRQDSRNRLSIDSIQQLQHGESKQSGSNVVFNSSHRSQTIAHNQSHSQENEDLGIIDLDNCELFQDDDFDELDDEKLPVLKNTYSKKNRPNNSKSVAVGSRSQGGVLKTRQIQGAQSLNEFDEDDVIKELDYEHVESEDHRSVKYLKNVVSTSGEQKFGAEERNGYLNLESRSSFQIIRKQNDSESLKGLEIDQSSVERASVTSLPVAGRRQIQSAGGKRGEQSRNSSTRDKRQNLHFLSQGDTLFIPTNLENVDIEEVQIFVRQKKSKRALRAQPPVPPAQQQSSKNLDQTPQQTKKSQLNNTQQQQSAQNQF